MDNIKCSNCDNEISKEATTCPKCGHPNKPANSKLPILIIIAAILAVLVFLNVDVFEHKVKVVDLSDVYEKVVSDQIKQYEIAKRQGDPMQICVQAGLVSAAYLQAKNEYKYQEWKATEATDCQRAGLKK